MFGWIFSEFNIRKRHFLFSSNDIVRYGGKVNSLNSSIILEVGVRMVRKKHVVGRRVLSILLCMLIVLCTVPMIAIAAADGAGVKVTREANHFCMYTEILQKDINGGCENTNAFIILSVGSHGRCFAYGNRTGWLGSDRNIQTHSS